MHYLKCLKDIAATTGLHSKRPSTEEYVKRTTQARSGRGNLSSSHGLCGKIGVQLRIHLEKQAQTTPAPALERRHNYGWN
jgi:hypothetical protein